MKLVKSWKLKENNKFWLIIEKEDYGLRIVFSKANIKNPYYRIEFVEDAEYIDDQLTAFIDLEEHNMIHEIVNELYINKEL